MYVVVLVSSLLAASLALALQRPLAQIFHHWRSSHGSRPSSVPPQDARNPVGTEPGSRTDAAP